MTVERERYDRSHRLTEIREAFSTAAEHRVREAEHEFAAAEVALKDVLLRMNRTREELAYVDGASADKLQNAEKHLVLLEVEHRRCLAAHTLAKKELDRRREEWKEAEREVRVAEKIQARRLQEWERSLSIAEQKEADDLSTGRFVRNANQAGEIRS